MSIIHRYERMFSQHQAQGRKAFIPFTLLGWPSLEHSYHQLACMIDCGVSALEIGLPFSDPVADGPIIQSAVFEALTAGFQLKNAWSVLAKVRALDAQIPIGLLVYTNMVLAVGMERFCELAKTNGVDGILLADLPPEMAEAWVSIAKAHELDTIFIVSTLTTPERLATIARLGSGFLYGVSRLGVTGVENRYEQDISRMLSDCHHYSPLPVCMGFGISKPADAKQMIAAGADGYITGSRVIQLVQENPQDLDKGLKPFLTEMVEIGRFLTA